MPETVDEHRDALRDERAKMLIDILTAAISNCEVESFVAAHGTFQFDFDDGMVVNVIICAHKGTECTHG